ncbi:MAG: hypothetical protein ACRERD_30670 [Candidatus Binatia bacterium]
MNRATPKLRRLAQRLLALEAAADTTADAHAPPVFRVCETLRRSLSRLVGVAGFRSLLSRALAAVSDEVRWLKAVHITADGSLEGLGEVEGQLSQAEMTQGELLLIAQLIGLLVTFIGETLTMHLVQEAWPELPSGDLDF